MAAHENMEQREEVRGSSDRAFGFVFAIFFLVVALLPLFWGRLYWWALGVSAGFLVVAWLFPAALSPLNRLWFRFGLLLHAVINPIVLGIMFYGVVLPTGLVMRALGKDPLRLRFDRNVRSYWIKRDPPGPQPGSFRDQF